MRFTFESDDVEEFQRFLLSPQAWQCLYRLNTALRNHLKHDAPIDVGAMYLDICETLGRIEE